MTTHTKEDVVQRGLTKVPANQQPFLLQRANATQEVVQIDLLLVDRKGGDGSARFHQLQILAYVHLHKLRNVGNRRIQVHRQHQTATVLVLQMDLAADALNALVRQDGDAIAQRIRLFHRVRRQQDRHLALHRLHRVPDRHARLQIQTRLFIIPPIQHNGRLIEEEQERTTHQRHTQSQATLLTTTQLRGTMLEGVARQTDLLGDVLHQSASLVTRHIVEMGNELQMLLHRHVIEEHVELRHHTNQLLHGKHVRERVAKDLQIALVWIQLSRHDADKCGLSSSVRSQQSKHLSVVNGETDFREYSLRTSRDQSFDPYERFAEEHLRNIGHNKTDALAVGGRDRIKCRINEGFFLDDILIQHIQLAFGARSHLGSVLLLLVVLQ